MNHHQIVIVGGGTAGITVAARLKNADASLDVAVIEPSEKHYYQPLWTLVGGGMFEADESARNEAELIPYGVNWIKKRVASFSPAANSITTDDGETIGYDYLVVAPGIQINWDQVKGLKESVGKDGVCSNYSIDTVASTWKFIRELKQGVALFTQPAGAVKCGGAPQKICYLAEDHFRRTGVRDNVDVIFTLAGPRLFAVDRYRIVLEQVCQRKKVEPRYRHNLVEIRPASKEAVYRHMDTDEELVIKYDMIHVTPPMSAPDFVAQSELAGETGWVEVDKHTLQHTRFPNVYGLGDASSLPTSKTGAAIRKQAPVLVANLLASMNQQSPTASYDGYTSCPVVTGYDSLVLAEFDYSGQPAETFPFEQDKERFSMFMSKKFGLPAMYWHGMLKGRV
ncbi:NAD(P)/FAD-dependent oxidoreductase [Fuerstiella marisgermanici]|uniref:Sulfide dehydrogenase [flavocytochrome c] flavoprotein chain n=1 Tax=Fuerstiella marisgermanici TaxID=1891926 RepID=A0A1P8W9H2_9PLAN|nr:FAD/NAD(P)-binding oxidoreductase [Fuerstiella marisgermanici]APZ90708.1 Sulfide dehydrogenase [flavocytochrome c] flavoprotein chain precursor [Fuerstiella marisgermanici]